MKVKLKVVGVFVIFLIGNLVFKSVINNDNKTFEVKREVNKEMLSMMLENDEGNYEEVTQNTWPDEGYMFNTTLSHCENGGELSWDSEKKIVVMNGVSSDKCYVYFDKAKITLANYIKGLYTGTQGDNNLYLHFGLQNGAGDSSYRYAGASDTTNNFVCFGYDSKNGECPSDNLYRIIGVFGDNVKLIKWDYATYELLGTDGDYKTTYKSSIGAGTSKGVNTQDKLGGYYWNYNANTTINNGYGSNVWSMSFLNKINLNTNFINNIGKNWAEKIAMTTWKVGGDRFAKIAEQTPPTAYVNEIVSPILIENKKIGLLYVSDYLFAASPNYWNLVGYNSSDATKDYRAAINSNWLYMGLIEWTITPQTDDNYLVADIVSVGNISFSSSGGFAVRPVFNLESTVNYASGNGTMDKPFIIAM